MKMVNMSRLGLGSPPCIILGSGPFWIDSQTVMGDDAGIEASREDPTTGSSTGKCSEGGAIWMIFHSRETPSCGQGASH
jgi:hypothetical protein